jgi:peptide/nickel transport system substrate-binding protein
MSFRSTARRPARTLMAHLRAALLGTATVAASLSGVGFAAAQEAPLVIARNMDLDSLDPHRGFCDTCQIYFSAVYETLVGIGPDNKTIGPNIAESYEVNDNQTVFTFKLNPAAKFSDGSPVEAKDVKWSLERLKGIKGNPAYFVDAVTSIETPDDKTVVITLSAPNSEFLGMLTAPYTGVVNSDVAAAAGAIAAENDPAEGWFRDNSAGSGPYVNGGWKPDEELRFKANTNYWREKPDIAEVVIRQTKDAVAQAQALESGAADIAMQIDPDTAKTVSSPDVTIEQAPSFNFLYLAFSPGAKGLPAPMTAEVRAALAMAIDYDGMIEFTLGGAGKKQAAPIPNGFPGTSNLPMPVSNPEEAKKALADAGYADVTLEAAFPAMNVYGVDLSILMQKAQQDLAAVGVKLELMPMTFAVWRERLLGDGIPVTTAFFAPDYYGSAQYVQFFGIYEGTPWSKRSHIAQNAPDMLNPREASLLAEALAAPADQQEAAYGAVALEMIGDRVIIPVVSPNLVLAYRKNISGVRYSVCCNLPLAEIKRN